MCIVKDKMHHTIEELILFMMMVSKKRKEARGVRKASK